MRVLDGAVRPTSAGFPVPHLYGAWDDPRGAELCLYYPPDEIMLLGQQVAQQLLPWAFEWLHYYEIWLVTGVWSGPEAPHKVGEPPVTNGTGGETRPPSVLRPIHAPLMGSMGYLLAQNAAC